MEQLHKGKQYWVPIVDPGIKVDPGYPAYDQGIAAKAFISDFTGNPYLGQVVILAPSVIHILNSGLQHHAAHCVSAATHKFECFALLLSCFSHA